MALPNLESLRERHFALNWCAIGSTVPPLNTIVHCNNWSNSCLSGS
jgi:hypothetical protein